MGAWGARAGDLLERGAERRGDGVHRVGDLAMLHPPDLVGERWCCWLFGEPEDRGVLATCFGLEAHNALPAAFGRALNELGEAACELLRGRFLIVVLDRRRERCLLTRDQLGAQPLTYAQTADGVLFAEHERDLLEMLPRTPGPDRLALVQWIEDASTPRGHSLYENVRHVPAGHRVISEATAASLRQMLEGVLAPGGTAAEIQIPGYTLAGNTGTANSRAAPAAAFAARRLGWLMELAHYFSP